MLSVMIPQDSTLKRYLRQRYRVDSWKGFRSGVPAIDERAIQIEQEIRELEEQLCVPREKLDRLYSNWRPVEAGCNAISNVIHERCESCKHYYANIPEQRSLAKWATQMCMENDSLPKEVIPQLKARAKPCPQGVWDVFVVNEEKDRFELAVGNRFIGPEICPDFQEVKK